MRVALVQTKPDSTNIKNNYNVILEFLQKAVNKKVDLICFPELALNYALKGAKFILNPSASPNLPSKRVDMWSKYLVARAYDNRVWVLATNLLFNGKGGGLITYDSNGDKIMSYEKSDEYMEIIEMTFEEYSKTKRNRIFNEDRRVDLYGSHNEKEQ